MAIEDDFVVVPTGIVGGAKHLRVSTRNGPGEPARTVVEFLGDSDFPEPVEFEGEVSSSEALVWYRLQHLRLGVDPVTEGTRVVYVIDWWETVAEPANGARVEDLVEGTTLVESSLAWERIQELVERASLAGYDPAECWAVLDAADPGSFRLVGHGAVDRGHP